MKLSEIEYEYILRQDLVTFIERAFYELNPQTTLLMSPYIELIAAKLEACRLGKIHRLIINLPPRYLKSHCASIAFVAWLMGHNPSTPIICASYGQELADKLARDCRRVMRSPWYQRLFATRLSERHAVADFATTEQGYRLATSVGGPLTGRGGDFIIIDDAMKPDDALSDPRRKSANQWFDNTALSRLNSKESGCIIIIMQRLHQDDLVGHVQEQGAWDVLSLPAIAEDEQTFLIESSLGSRFYRRATGDVLHPERESRETLQQIRQTIGEYNFSAQYQQSPTPLDGAMVKTEWFESYDSLPERFSRIVQSWDTANKADELNDYSVCTTWGVLDKTFYLLHVYRGRLNYPELKRKVVELAEGHGANTVLIEDKASGTQLIQDLAHQIYGVKGYKPPPGTDKQMRLHSQTAVFENGFVRLPASAGWLADYITELTTFLGSKYDDQVDSTTQALDYMRGASSSIEIWAKLGHGYVSR